jgi:hypothetical protein
MKVRYQTDNDLRLAIVRGVVRSEPLVDFRSAQAARLDRKRDPEVLTLAADDGRILVSHDFRTMPDTSGNLRRTNPVREYFLISQDLPVGQAIESLCLIWEASDASEWENRVCLIPSLVTLGV